MQALKTSQGTSQAQLDKTEPPPPPRSCALSGVVRATCTPRALGKQFELHLNSLAGCFWAAGAAGEEKRDFFKMESRGVLKFGW